MSAGTTIEAEVAEIPRLRSATAITLRDSLRYRETQVGLVLAGFIILIAIFGPLFAPHGPSELFGRPFSGPGGGAPLGTDYIGRDILSRLLNGGRTVVGLSLASTVLGMAVGVAVGLAAVFSRRSIDAVIMGLNDVILAVPQIVLVLVFVSFAGSALWLIILIVALSHSPRVMRLTRSVAMEIERKEYVEYAQLAGVTRRSIAWKEIMPNLSTPLLVEFGVRLAWSIALIAGLSFIGYGIQPPQSDWGLMINENRAAIGTEPLVILAPIACIVTFTIGAGLITEGLARAAARMEGFER